MHVSTSTTTLDGMNSPGQFNCEVLLWLCIAVGLVSRVLINIAAEVPIIDQLLKHPRISVLSRLSIFASELKTLESKHFQEFISIFAATQVPKIPLERIHVTACFDVNVSALGQDSLTVHLSGSQRDMQMYRNIPLGAVRECFFPDDADKAEKQTWKGLFVNVFSRPKKVEEGYYAFGGLQPGTSQRETCAMRIDRKLSRFRFPTDENIHVDFSVDEDHPSIPLLLISGSQMTWVTGEGVKTVYYRPDAEKLVFFAELANLYGLERASECMICCDALVDTILIDCCHCCTCQACANSFRDAKCPICRSTVKEKIIIPLTRDIS